MRRRIAAKPVGFTIVEMLLVIVILGVIGGVVVFAVGSSTTSAQEKACEQERQVVQQAVQVYRADTQEPPTDVSDLLGPGIAWLHEAPSWHTVDGMVVSGDGVKCPD